LTVRGRASGPDPRTGTDLRLRRARASDAASIQALEALFPGDRLSRRSIQRLIGAPSAVMVVAVPASRHRPASALLGALILLTRRNSRAARIYSLAVHPDARGRGLAQALIRRAEACARQRGCVQMTLEVRDDNVAARRLYEKLGYRAQRVLPAYYQDGADGVRFQRQFSAGRR
jgi:[ribosomal protein S18]-alanine N-acetyltransferase